MLHIWHHYILSHHITISQYHHFTISPFWIHFIISPAAEVWSSATWYTFLRSAPPSTSRYNKRKPKPRTDDMAYAMAEKHRLWQFGGTYNGAMEDAIATRRKNPQCGGQSPRSRDSSGRPSRLSHETEFQIRLQTSTIAYAIMMGRWVTQFGRGSSRSRDPSGRPHQFTHGSEPNHSPPLYEWM